MTNRSGRPQGRVWWLMAIAVPAATQDVCQYEVRPAADETGWYVDVPAEWGTQSLDISETEKESLFKALDFGEAIPAEGRKRRRSDYDEPQEQVERLGAERRSLVPRFESHVNAFDGRPS